MTDEKIKLKVEKLIEKAEKLAQKRTSVLVDLSFVRKRCHHHQISWWTNNDGDGQFRVERCDVCGLQQDNGLPEHAGQVRTKRSY